METKSDGASGLTELLGRTQDQSISPPDKYIHINAKEVRNNFSEITHAIDFKNERVVVTHRNKAKVALVPIHDLQKLDEIEKALRSGDLSNEEKLTHISRLFEEETEPETGGNDVPVSGSTRIRKRSASP